MTKLNLDLEAIQLLHQTGKLTDAKRGYLALLKINPRDANILHSLSILCAQQHEFGEAVEYLEAAIQYQPGNMTFLLHLANLQKAQGLHQKAIHTLEALLKKDADFAPAYNNLGSIHFSLGKLSQAIIFYQKALQLEPDYIDAYYNLGLAYTKLNQYNEAIQTYQKLLDISPNHFAARFHHAKAFMLQGKFKEAEKEFLNIEATHPFHLETQSNLATCFLKQGALKQAKEHYQKALEIAPEDTQILFNLGAIYMRESLLDEAIPYYQRAITIDPNYFEAHNNLGIAFIARQHPEFALKHFKEALRIQPNNQAIAYTIEALKKNPRLLDSPPDYITTLFDAYADHYDAHLVEALDYKVPQLLLDAVATVKNIPHASWDILDLGCGTGLCGSIFKSAAKKLIGVDLSSKMLAIANNKKIYDELIQSELNAFLKNQTNAYDLILAGDVFVYRGDLDALFALANQALKEKGLLAFNAEITQEADFKINQSGRFQHHKKYLDSLALKHHFTIAYYKVGVTRLQNNEPVPGHLYVLSKNA